MFMLAQARAALELAGLGKPQGTGSAGGGNAKGTTNRMEVSAGGESWVWQQVCKLWGLWSTEGGEGLARSPAAPGKGRRGWMAMLFDGQIVVGGVSLHQHKRGNSSLHVRAERL